MPCRTSRWPTAPRPLLLLDSHYDVGDLVGADLGVDNQAPQASNRRL